MRALNAICIGAAVSFGSATEASATARIHIDLSNQRMHVESASGSYDWPVSTARSGYYTPRGSFAPTGMQRMHYSRKYHMSPMPYSIFFRGGYAIHGSYETNSLGRPASHGCVRLSPDHAAQLYHMVQSEGGSIAISGSPPPSRRFATIRRTPHYAHRYAAAPRNLAYEPARYRSYRSMNGWQVFPLFYFFQ